MKRLIFLSCLIVLLAVASDILHGTPPAAEPSVVKTGEETETLAVAPEPADGYVFPPQALAADTAPRVPPQDASETAAPDEPAEPTEQPSETVQSQPPDQSQSANPSTEPLKTSANLLSTPQSGDKRTVDGQAEIWIPGFGWIPDNGGGSVGTIATSDGDINKMVGYMGGDDPPKRETSPPESYVPHVGDVQVDIQTGEQKVLTEDGLVEQK